MPDYSNGWWARWAVLQFIEQKDKAADIAKLHKEIEQYHDEARRILEELREMRDRAK